MCRWLRKVSFHHRLNVLLHIHVYIYNIYINMFYYIFMYIYNIYIIFAQPLRLYNYVQIINTFE